MSKEEISSYLFKLDTRPISPSLLTPQSYAYLLALLNFVMWEVLLADIKLTTIMHNNIVGNFV